MNPQMRMLVLLAVFWVAGSLLLAAESPPTSAPKPAVAAKEAEGEAQNPDKVAADKAAADKAAADKKAESDPKTGTKEAPKGSIADQAEAALKAAAEADPGAAAKEEAQKSDEQDAKDDTQVQPAASASKAPSPQRFMPTEQVRADFDVSFPIDI